MLFERYNKLNFSLETIDFQSDDFGKKLETIIAQVCQNIDNQMLKVSASYVTEIQDIVKQRLGFGIELITDQQLASAIPFFMTPNHIFLEDKIRGEKVDTYVKRQLALIDKNSNKLTGYVNTANATVGGDFSKITAVINLNIAVLRKNFKLNPGEITALLLHEVGHVFTTLEYSDRFDKNNQVLSELCKVLLNNKSSVDSKYLYKELVKIDSDIKQEEVDKLLSGDKIISCYYWMKLVLGSSKLNSQLGNDAYSESSSEQLADNFASRFNYSKELVLALDKTAWLDGNYYKNKNIAEWFMLFSFFGVLVTLSLTWAILTTASGGMLFAIAYISYGLLNLFSSGSEGYKYDKSKSRYIRVRNDIVQMLKNSDVDKNTAKVIVENIYVVDEIIKKSEDESSLVTNFLNVFKHSDRKRKKSVQEERLLEELSSNSLFVKAVELRFMA